MDVATFQTVAVAATAFGKSLELLGERESLTHSMKVETGEPLCKSVKAKNLLDDVHATDPDAKPTCKICLKRDPRFA